MNRRRLHVALFEGPSDFDALAAREDMQGILVAMRTREQVTLV